VFARGYDDLLQVLLSKLVLRNRKNGSRKWGSGCVKREGDFNLRYFSICSL